MPDSSTEKIACLKILAAAANLNGDPTPAEFEAFLAALNTFQPVPSAMTPENLLSCSINIPENLNLITTPAMQQQAYRGTHAIVRSKGIDAQEAQLLNELKAAFGLSAELTKTLEKQPLVRGAGGGVNSALAGMASLIGREGEVRRLVFDYSLGAAIVGLVPLTGGGTLEVKLLIVLALILKMIWDIRNLWGQPRGQDILAIVGNIFGFIGAIIAGFLAWATLIGLGVVIPYAGAFDKAAGFATATWVAGQATNQFYTSQKRPDFSALKRAFPNLMSSDRS
ncbi:MAG: hypothetical protein ACFBSG_12770 [Leptolyngbyaceae cyanobacterium]